MKSEIKNQKSTAKAPVQDKKVFAINKQNYKFLAIGFGLIVLGFLLMLGGGTNDPNVFNPALFSFTRITLAPILVMGGFALEIYAILWKPKQPKEQAE